MENRVLDCKRAVIIGAGPAGLTAAYELLKRTGVVPLVLERSTYMGGIALRRGPRVSGRLRKPVPDRPERHAQIQQPGSLDAYRDDRGR